MNDSILYFPYIDIPKNNWTVKSLLYWDNVGIIVPNNYIDRPEQYDQFTIDLLQTDLITQIFPGDYIYKVRNFDESFIRLINQEGFDLHWRQNAFRRGLNRRVHIQKFGERLLEHLVDLQIAQRLNWEWYLIETRTAKLIMVYLATVLGKVCNYTPATDEIRNLDLSISQRGTSFKLSAIRQSLIEDLIPFPIEPDLTKLRKFKDKYHEELTSYRILIEQIAYDLSLLKSKQHQTDKHQLKIAEINDKKTKLLRDLNQSKLGKIVFGTICGIAGTTVGLINPTNLLVAFPFLHAVYSAFQGYKDRQILDKDYSYLALIDKKFKPDEGFSISGKRSPIQ